MAYHLQQVWDYVYVFLYLFSYEAFDNALLYILVSIERGCCAHIKCAVNVVCEGVSLDQAKKSRGTDLVAGAAPMPREMSFPLGASENWNDVYDYIRCI